MKNLNLQSGLKGDWIQTYTNRRFYPLSPKQHAIDIRDIAHALGNLCRYNGHCSRFYSVAEHSIHVSNVVARINPELALWGLLHDAAEAYVADVPRPLKPYLPGYKEIETRVQEAICLKFGLEKEMPPEVKIADDALLADEAKQLSFYGIECWYLPRPPSGTKIHCWGPLQSEDEFFNLFDKLRSNK